MKKLFLLFVTLVATTCLWAHDFEVDGIYYNYLEDNNVKVTYKGNSYNDYNEYSGAVSIPSTVTYNGTAYNVTSIGKQAFSSCDSLRTVICEAVEVPELEMDVFSGTPLSYVTLYVRAQSLDDYKAADQWKDFGRILPLEEAPSAVENTRLPIANGAKLLRDGQVYILKDNKVYTLMGAEIQ